MAGVDPSPSGTSTLDATPLAVLDFHNNSGNSRYDALGRGLAVMMVTDLSEVPSVQLVERSRLQELVTELNLQQDSRFDPETAQQVGLLVGAEYMLFGSIAALEPEIRLDTRIVQVSTGEIVKTAQVTGKEKNLFDLQDKLAEELIDGIEISLSPEQREALRASREKNRIPDMETMLAFSEALAYMDQEDWVSAAERLAVVSRNAPGTMMVQLAYSEAQRRVADSARNRARETGGRILRGLTN
ncbi:MAG: CsgG/HfaB family protein [Gemmatimonadota bacterium]|nr:CsgG/HfaB family protein [Gemmatimonadota bacterium]